MEAWLKGYEDPDATEGALQGWKAELQNSLQALPQWDSLMEVWQANLEFHSADTPETS